MEKKFILAITTIAFLLGILCFNTSCAHNHKWSEWETVTNPECRKEGARERICSSCNSVETEPLAALEHNFQDGICTLCKHEEGASEGLEIVLNPITPNHQSASVIGIGECTDANIVIPGYFEGVPVEQIKADAFKDCQTLESIVCSKNITYIAASAFENCQNLTSVTASREFGVGNSAFENCYALTDFPFELISFVGNSSFKKCQNLTGTLYFPETFSGEIGESAFEGCLQIESVVFSDKTSIIGDYAFKSCFALRNIYFGKELLKIGTDAFPATELDKLYPQVSDLRATYPLSEKHWDFLVSNYGFIGTIKFNSSRPAKP